MVESVITVNNIGYGDVVSKMELYAGKKLLDCAYIDKYSMSIENNFVMFFTYDKGSDMHTHAFSVDKVIVDLVAYVPLKVSQREERRKIREEKKRRKEEEEKNDRLKFFRQLFCWKDIKVKSTNLDIVNYDPSNRVLRIIFKSSPNTTYAYKDVNIEVFEGLILASSHGKYFNEYIKGNYMWEYE